MRTAITDLPASETSDAGGSETVFAMRGPNHHRHTVPPPEETSLFSDSTTVFDEYTDLPSVETFVVADVPVVFIMVASVLASIICIAHIATCLGSPKVRADPSKWLQLLTVLSLLVSFLLDLTDGWGPQIGLNRIWGIPGLCQVLQPTIAALTILFTTGLILVALERLVALWKDGDPGPAFSQRTTAILLAITVAAAFVFSYGICFGLGGVHFSHYGSVYFCTYSEGSHHTFFILNFVGAVVVVILTAFLIGRLCKVRCVGETYPMDKALPVIAGGLVFTIYFLVMFFTGNSIPWIHLVALPAIPAIWFLGDKDLRRQFKKICCRCCLQEDEDETKPILLHWFPHIATKWPGLHNDI